MLSVRPVQHSTALQIMHAVTMPSARRATPAPGASLLAAANDVAVPGVSDAQSQAKARIAESFFGGGPNIEELKFHLFKRLGAELGVDMDNYDDAHAYASALRQAVTMIKVKAAAEGNSDFEIQKVFDAMAKDLGLDDLGLSVDDLIGAIDFPDSKVGHKLDEALRAETGEAGRQAVRDMKQDEAGLYSP